MSQNRLFVFFNLSISIIFLCFLQLSCDKSKDTPTPDPDAGVGSTGSVSFTYRGQKVTYTTVRAKDGNIWSQQDLGSKRVAAQMRDTLGYGDFFQWGRWDDGHQVRRPAANTVAGTSLENNPAGIRGLNPAPFVSGWWSGGNSNDLWTIGNPSEVMANNACDPCKAMGKGWRLPTDAEWTRLVETEDIKNSETAFASTLKIPAGGWRNLSNPSSILAVGADSWYWTSTPAGGRGKGVWILPSAVHTSYSDDRSWGTSIRCIKMTE